MVGFVDIEGKYDNRVLKIWSDPNLDEILDIKTYPYRKFPLLPKQVRTNSILFIGINPSFNRENKVPEDEKPIAFYPLYKEKEKPITYFQKMNDIAEYCNSDWTHLDLFFMREREQKLIANLARKHVGFLNKQLDITFEIIHEARPKLIIVANALASEFFGKKKTGVHREFDKIWQGHDFYFENNPWGKEPTFDEGIGTYRMDIGNKKVPILFSGMLSGQRALDIGSLERLKWQARKILLCEQLISYCDE